MGNRLLYKGFERDMPPKPSDGHLGLWYDKLCDQWECKDGTWKIDGEKKKEWIKKVPLTVPFKEQGLKESIQRLQNMLERLGGQSIVFKTVSPFVTGLGITHPVENGFAWHHTLGVPYLPGSSLKGALRSWVSQWLLDTQLERRAFGPRPAERDDEANQTKLDTGSVLFFDALPCGKVKLVSDVMTPHYAEYYQEGDVPGDWLSPVPIPFLTVAQGAEFLICLAPRSNQNEQHRKDCQSVLEHLSEALEHLGAGAKTAVGYGRFAKA